MTDKQKHKEEVYNMLDDFHRGIVDNCEHLRSLMRTGATDENIDEEFKKFLSEHGEYLSQKLFAFDDLYVAFYALTTIAENHIRQKDMLNTIYHFEELRMFYEDFEENAQFPQEQKQAIRDLVLPVYEQFRISVYQYLHPRKEIKYSRSPENICLLCKSNKATKTGSHLVPHFLIQPFFSYDGSTKRDKEVVQSYSVADGDHRTYIGHRVDPDYLEQLYGRPLTDEEVERESTKFNVLMRDYYFCPECEQKMSVVENYYSQILSGEVVQYPPAVPYLFWLSVVWRMSIGRLAIHMLPEQEQRIRKVLSQGLHLDRNKLAENTKLDYFAYRIGRVTNMKGETPCIIGSRETAIPYIMLIGNLALCFFPSWSTTKKNAKRSGIDEATINNGRKKEVISELPFIDFWMFKQHITQSVYKCPSAYDGTAVQDLEILRPFEIPSSKTMKALLGEHYEGKLLNMSMVGEKNILSMPKAVSKIIAAMEKSESVEGDKQAFLEKETGYTAEEIEYMWGYYNALIGKNLD